MKNQIVARIEITASLERVWTLVSEPGWWINNGALGDHRIERRGAECTVTDEELGDFAVGIVAMEPMTRAVFTWHPGGDDVPRTTIEFTLTSLTTETVRVSVVESGFSQMTPDEHRRNFDANKSGWKEELSLALHELTHEPHAPRP